MEKLNKRDTLSLAIAAVGAVGFGIIKLNTTYETPNYHENERIERSDIITPEYEAVISKSAELFLEFPKEFSDANNLIQNLNNIYKDGLLNIYNISQENLDFPILSMIETEIRISKNIITSLRPKIIISPLFFDMPTAEQVMMLTNKINQFKTRDKILKRLKPKIINKKYSPEIIEKINEYTNIFNPEIESEELFKNCSQIFALKTADSSFTLSYNSIIDKNIIKSTDKSLYSIYLDVKDLPAPENSAEWKDAILWYISFNY